MARDPSFRFYPDDFVAGTVEMTNAEIGSYILLLCYQWNKGMVPNNDEKLRRIGKADPDLQLGTIKGKFFTEDGVLKNRRLEFERKKQQDFREKQRQNGSKGGRPKEGQLYQTESKNKFELNPIETQEEAKVNPKETQPATQLKASISLPLPEKEKKKEERGTVDSVDCGDSGKHQKKEGAPPPFFGEEGRRGKDPETPQEPRDDHGEGLTRLSTRALLESLRRKLTTGEKGEDVRA